MSQTQTKVCSRCGRTLPISQFYRVNKNRDERLSHCKECDRIKSRKFYNENPEYFSKYKQENREWINLKQRECNFLNRPTHRTGGYLRGTGICVFCGEINPFLLESHHPFGPDHSLEIHECANCHLLQHRFPAMLEVKI